MQESSHIILLFITVTFLAIDFAYKTSTFSAIAIVQCFTHSHYHLELFDSHLFLALASQAFDFAPHLVEKIELNRLCFNFIKNYRILSFKW